MIGALVAIGLLCLVPRLCRWLQDVVGRPTATPPPQPYDEAYDAVIREIGARNGRRDAWRDYGNT